MTNPNIYPTTEMQIQQLLREMREFPHEFMPRDKIDKNNLRENRPDNKTNGEKEIINPAPLFVEGDLRPVYQSVTREIPEALNPEAFSVSEKDEARIIEDDSKLIKGLNMAFSSLEDHSGSYFIVNIGHAHLPGVAVSLLEKKIDCSFMIPGEIHPRFKKAIKYWAGEYSLKKPKHPVGYATLIDCHRGDIDPTYSITRKQFPSVETLKRLGVKKVFYLDERTYDGKFDKNYPGYGKFKELFENYRRAGIVVSILGIDTRKEKTKIDENLTPQTLDTWREYCRNFLELIGIEEIK